MRRFISTPQRSFLTFVQQYQKGVTFTMGKLTSVKEPGLRIRIPFIQTMTKVNMRDNVVRLPLQKIITADNSTIEIDGVVSYRITDAEKAVIEVEHVHASIAELAQLKIREATCSLSVDSILKEKEHLNKALVDETIIEKFKKWGVHINSLELRDNKFDESMIRAMSKKAEALREREAQVIAAEAEILTAKKYSEAARTLNSQEGAMQLRGLETLLQVAKEKNTIILFPSNVLDRLSSSTVPIIVDVARDAKMAA